MKFQFENGKGVTLVHVGRNLLRAAQASAIQEFNKSVSVPPRPTYEIEILGGGTEVHPHNDVSIDMVGTREDKVAYLKWLRSQNLKTAIVQKANFEAMLVAGIKEEPGDDWVEFAKDFGIPLGETKREQKVRWVERWLVGSRQEMKELLRAISSIKSELEEEAEKSASRFRHLVRQARRGEKAI